MQGVVNVLLLLMGETGLSLIMMTANSGWGRIKSTVFIDHIHCVFTVYAVCDFWFAEDADEVFLSFLKMMCCIWADIDIDFWLIYLELLSWISLAAVQFCTPSAPNCKMFWIFQCGLHTD